MKPAPAIPGTRLPPELITKTITVARGGMKTSFDVSQALFSSYALDTGTHALLNSLRNPKATKTLDYSTILDLGCGWGAAGILLKKEHSSAVVDLVDRDALALAFAEHNAEKNNVRVHVFGSLDYEKITHAYSLIALNFPAKIGDAALKHFVYGASKHLIPGGTLAIVVITQLTQVLEHIMSDPVIRVNFLDKRKHYTIAHLSFVTSLPLTSDHYHRATMTDTFRQTYSLSTVRDIEEFDTLSYETLALHELFKNARTIAPLLASAKKIAILEPGQGHGALLVHDYLSPEHLTLYSRDLLALQCTMNNLPHDTNTTINHCAFLDKPIPDDVCVWHVTDKHSGLVHAHNANILASGKKPFIIYGYHSLVRRVLNGIPHRVVEERQVKKGVAQYIMPKST